MKSQAQPLAQPSPVKTTLSCKTPPEIRRLPFSLLDVPEQDRRQLPAPSCLPESFQGISTLDEKMTVGRQACPLDPSSGLLSPQNDPVEDIQGNADALLSDALEYAADSDPGQRRR